MDRKGDHISVVLQRMKDAYIVTPYESRNLCQKEQ